MSAPSNQHGVRTHHHALRLTTQAAELQPLPAAWKLRRLDSPVHRRLARMVISLRLVDSEVVLSIIRRLLRIRLEVHSRRLQARITAPRTISCISLSLAWNGVICDSAEIETSSSSVSIVWFQGKLNFASPGPRHFQRIIVLDVMASMTFLITGTWG